MMLLQRADNTNMNASPSSSKVRFISEQDGMPEQEFKRRLLPVLSKRAISEAYLALVDYDEIETPVPAVCLVGDAAEAHRVCVEIAEVFTSLFQKTAPLDLMFITREQRAELARVCQPFYLHRDSAMA